MKIVLILVLIVAGIIGMGFYRGWFTVSSDSQGDTRNITVSVDKEKIREDKDKAVEKVQDLEQRAKAKVAATTRKAQD
jgi:hypothetical protein